MKNTVQNKNVTWNLVGVTLNASYSLFLLIFITRINGINAAGDFSYAFYITSVLSAIGMYGGRIFQVTDISKRYSSDHYISSRLLTSLVMFIVTFLFCLISLYSVYTFLLFLVMIAYRAVEAVCEMYFGIMQINDNLAAVGKSMSLKTVLTFVLFILIDLLTKNIVLASLSLVFSFIIIYFFYDRKIASKYTKIVFNFTHHTFVLLKESFSPFIFALLGLIMLNIVRYFIEYRGNSTIQGYFSIINMPAATIALLSQFLFQPLLNNLVKLHQVNKMKFFSIVKLLLIALTLMGILLAIISYFIGAPILGFVYHVDISSYRFELSLIVLSGIFSGAVGVISNILILMRQMRIQILMYTLSIALGILISYLYVRDLSSSLYTSFIIMLGEFIIFLLVFYFIVRKSVKDSKK
ncbi:hypothetical protein [Lactovum miscens]|uniref:O-antigen/teichoic acid export membrane protein n=1 Tax=Lactovum miscens TaxID=190387 RepID=A0A841C801_9LACT|nr:hypothetical protein [Lactovum miscens]MBB5887681.1 O-antigen/teichoic acid export membrane protein [Lactovum miscens]